jgi:hypothetical protein
MESLDARILDEVVEFRPNGLPVWFGSTTRKPWESLQSGAFGACSPLD